MRAAHIVTEDGETFACAFEGERIVYALPVIEIEQHLLEGQINEAAVSYDNEQASLCAQLDALLDIQSAAEISTYFSVSV
jgi:hypothetical protein